MTVPRGLVTKNTPEIKRKKLKNLSFWAQNFQDSRVTKFSGFKDKSLFYTRGVQLKLISGPHWEKTPKNINFLGRILTKTEGNHPKYRKFTDFRSEFEPQKILLGPRVEHPCFIQRKICNRGRDLNSS